MDINGLITKNYRRLPVAREYKIPIIASTSKIWIKLPTAAPKPMYPTNHPINNNTIIMLIIPLITFDLIG